MAQKRMFSLSVIDTDRFLDMPASSQALYFHLGMHGDDDGFVSAPKKIARAAGCSEDDLRILVAKNFVIPFESGVVVIVDWYQNNTLKNDRYRETVYLQEKAKLRVDSTGRYEVGTNLEPTRNQDGTRMEPELNVTKHSIEERAGKPPRSRFVAPTVEEVQAYCRERSNGIDAAVFVDYYAARGWMAGRNHMKDWKAAVRNWERREKKEVPDLYADVI